MIGLIGLGQWSQAGQIPLFVQVRSQGLHADQGVFLQPFTNLCFSEIRRKFVVSLQLLKLLIDHTADIGRGKVDPFAASQHFTMEPTTVE